RLCPPSRPRQEWAELWLTVAQQLASLELAERPEFTTEAQVGRPRGAGARGRRWAMNAQQLLQEISDYCRRTGLAQSTFGRRAVTDGKLTARLRNGGRIPTDTLDRIHGFMAAHPAHGDRPAIIERARESRVGSPPPPAPAKTGDPQRNFRFFDNRQKYLL